jgi:hypothetical protein
MPPNGPATARRASVEALLCELGSRARVVRGQAPPEGLRRWPTGLAPLDRLLGGGFAEGRVGEIAGPASSGRTALALGLLAAATAREETVAVVDAADAFDPASAAGAGVDLGRTLWVRASALSEGLRASEILLRAGGFALVTLDLARRLERAPAPHHWLRLVRAAAATRTTLVVLSDDVRRVGSHADLALEMRRLRPRFEGSPPLLTGLETEVVVARHRRGPEGSVRLHFRGAP